MRSSRIRAGLMPLLLGALFLALDCVVTCSTGSAQALAACELRSRGGVIKHVVQIELDNVHLRRDDPNVPSDLEQMPHLRDFITRDGIIGSNHQTSPLAETATDALTILTGLHGDRMGVATGNSNAAFRSDGSIGFASAFAYWTATSSDGKPLMLADTGKTVPAPWVPFTAAGCDVGAFATTGLTLQEIGPEIAATLGPSEARAAAGDPLKGRADFLGIAIHCARGSALCSNANARSDLLPDEPGGYAGFSALFGNRNVQPVISPDGPVRDLDGDIIDDDAGHPGFPGASATTAAQSLGYAAAMLEAGVPVVYVGIGDGHRPPTTRRRALGPGEHDHVARLAADDAAFRSFIDRLGASGITTRNTLFVVVPTGNDRFVGGPPSPPGCDGLAVPCSYRPIGAIGIAIDRLLATERHNVTTFDVQVGNAPPFYIRGNPLPADPLTRTLAQDVGRLAVVNPVTGNTDRLTSMVADRAQMQLMHMVTASPARTPHVIMFADPDYIVRTAGSRADCTQPPACVAVNPDTAWVRGDIAQILGGSWFGMAGPGIAHRGETPDILSHHADLRPTLLAVLGLTDRYTHDGVVLGDALEPSALPAELADDRETYVYLARAAKTINDPLGQLGRNSLALATQAITGGDVGYQRYLDMMAAITTRRDALTREINTQLDGAAFGHRPINPSYARVLIGRAGALVNEVEDLAGSSLAPADRPWKAASDAH
ncbi:hypothetical protein JQ559_24545 [Bradyrhizobium viridifuturi]|jgi:hypothetical protein|uniref:hypothetical protein n=2 Tax=Nitrobacteraceae TaxID=41294 RepID=UPI0003975A78|nr:MULTISPECIES: hypothetical protein [Bradyrhizobium]ERF83106.1 MAG: hypothetical protein C207_03700 [Bradyrhizobium sp. DFCI-1]OYU63451.1 MAG: hypothetical protein CFE30_05170 [Bradyrhizobium sp. PARBB1]PSO23265.1 hypothetical protein C7G43_24050 [Bradyrhizobium sp. MOS004]QRI71431.1 hypothetical protein JQ507_08135 [Bradyrhizobium sp. PSBB068]MBR1023649.1 hypothetical protein [Bradyrhizobium viridifuturi]